MKISIITVSRNSADTIAGTVGSVLAQSHVDLEHIVIDGASDDGTPEIVSSYSDRYGDRLRLVSEPDNGIYDAINKGLALASGDVVGVLNSDDRYTAPDVLQRLTAPIAAGRADAVYADVHYVNERGRRVRYYSSARFRRWQMRFGVMPAHPTFYCRREVYDAVGVYDTSMRVAADFDWLLRALFVTRLRAEYVPLDCVEMLTGGASNAGLRSHLAIMRDHVRAYGKSGVMSNRVLDAMRYPFKLSGLVRRKDR